MITFLGMSSRTSGEIRGRQVASALGDPACFVDVHNPDFNVIAKNKTVLFVRTWEGALATSLKRQGYRVGYEIADMPVGDAVFRGAEVRDLDAYVHEVCDFYVVNNRKQSDDVYESLHRQGNKHKRVHIIPHHSTNFEGTAAPFRSRVARVGYVGLPEQLSGKAEIDALCAEHKCEFVSVHPNTREECDSAFRSLDVGIVFADGTANIQPRVVNLMKRYKPNTKLTNFQAYAIPSICTPYESYLDWGPAHDSHGTMINDGGVIYVDDKQSLIQSLERLLTNQALRLRMSNSAFERGKLFHIDQIKNWYQDL